MADPPHFVKYAQPVIRVRVFAGLRERAGWSEKELEGVGRVAEVWPALDLGEEPPGLLYAVNRAYADRDQELADGDEVALIPPVSGGAFLLSEEPLSLDAAVREVADERAGAIATFVGHDPHRLARPHGAVPRVRGLSGHGRGGHGTDRAGARVEVRAVRRSRSTTASAGSGSARRASSSPSPRRTGRTRSPPARRRSTRSRRRSRCGRRRSTREARSGSAEAVRPAACAEASASSSRRRCRPRRPPPVPCGRTSSSRPPPLPPSSSS